MSYEGFRVEPSLKSNHPCMSIPDGGGLLFLLPHEPFTVKIRAILVRTQRLSNFVVDVGPQGRSPETLRSRHRQQKGAWSSTISLGMNLGSNRTQNHTPYCQNDGDRWALFVTGVCSASAVAVSPELRTLVAVTGGARFLRNMRTHFKVR